MSSDESVGEVDENDLELIDRGEDIEEPENLVEGNEGPSEQNVDGETQDEAENKKAVKPKRIIKNPQPKLNERTLQEPRGLAALPGHFDRIKFKGRGYEEQDLNVLMKTYEYWCHRMIPKFTFDDCIARLETLGSKKITQTQIKRIRMGINLDDNDQVVSENEEGAAGSADETNAQFNELIINNDDSLPTTTPELSEAQLEQIRQNKERAQRLREERLRAIREKAQNNLQTSEYLSRENNQVSIVDTNACTSSSTDITTDKEPQPTNLEFDGESGKKNFVDDNEDNIDNILDFINTDEPTSTEQVLETNDIQESTTAFPKNKTLRRRIVESDEESEGNNQTTSNSQSPRVNTRKIIDSEEEEENMDIDNILTEMNAPDKNTSKRDKANDQPIGVNMGKFNEMDKTDHVIFTTENGNNGVVADNDNLENNLNVANVAETEDASKEIQQNTAHDDNVEKRLGDTVGPTSHTGGQSREGLEPHLKDRTAVDNSGNVVLDNHTATQDTGVMQRIETGNNLLEEMDTTN